MRAATAAARPPYHLGQQTFFGDSSGGDICCWLSNNVSYSDTSHASSSENCGMFISGKYILSRVCTFYKRNNLLHKTFLYKHISVPQYLSPHGNLPLYERHSCASQLFYIAPFIYMYLYAASFFLFLAFSSSVVNNSDSLLLNIRDIC